MKKTAKKLKEVEEELSNKILEDMYQIVKEEVEKVNSDEGVFLTLGTFGD